MNTSLRTSALVGGISLALMALLAPLGLLIALPAGATEVAALVVLVIAALDVVAAVALYPLLVPGSRLLALTAAAMRVAFGEFTFIGEVILLIWLIGWGGRTDMPRARSIDQAAAQPVR